MQFQLLHHQMGCCWSENLCCWWTQLGNCDDIWWYFREIHFLLKPPKSVCDSEKRQHDIRLSRKKYLCTKLDLNPNRLEVANKQMFLRGWKGFIQKSCHVYIYFIYFLCSAIIFKTTIFSNVEVQLGHIATTNQALWHRCLIWAH